MSKVAYRFVPCDEDGRPRENSQYTWVCDASEKIEVGSVLETDAPSLGYRRWEVVEIREDSGGLIRAIGRDGTPRGFGGTLVCRGIA